MSLAVGRREARPRPAGPTKGSLLVMRAWSLQWRAEGVYPCAGRHRARKEGTQP
jgi:hypothetical protein